MQPPATIKAYCLGLKSRHGSNCIPVVIKTPSELIIGISAPLYKI